MVTNLTEGVEARPVTLMVERPTLGTLFRLARNAKGLSPAEVAQQLGGYSAKTYLRIERDERSVSFDEVIRFARIVGQPISLFVLDLTDDLTAAVAPAAAAG